jgi:hypothetical protein
MTSETCSDDNQRRVLRCIEMLHQRTSSRKQNCFILLLEMIFGGCRFHSFYSYSLAFHSTCFTVLNDAAIVFY